MSDMNTGILKTGFVVGVFAALSFPALAQSPHGPVSQPYAGMQNREIKSLSEQQVADLIAGRGMGLALAAELNGYPGPSHLLELADPLQLSVDQRAFLQKVFSDMKAETIPIGERLLAQEAQLNRLFAEQGISAEKLKVATVAIGETQSELRNAHLRYHLQARDILNADQIKHYSELRGYTGQHHRHN